MTIFSYKITGRYSREHGRCQSIAVLTHQTLAAGCHGGEAVCRAPYPDSLRSCAGAAWALYGLLSDVLEQS